MSTPVFNLSCKVALPWCLQSASTKSYLIRMGAGPRLPLKFCMLSALCKILVAGWLCFSPHGALTQTMTPHA